jgi:FMN phosphatase YigB (HAD superfamily)
VAAPRFKWVLFDWGGTLMSEEGPLDVPMGLWPEVRAIEGAAETLAALSATYRIGLATNASVSRRPLVERALERVSLRQYVSEIFCFAEIGYRKDSAEFWAHVVETLGVSASEIAMVGDTLEPDVLGPRRHGVHAIWFNAGGRSQGDARGAPVVTRLRDVIPLPA